MTNNASPNDPLSRSLPANELPDASASLALLAKAQAGDSQALEDLVSRYAERLRRIVRIKLRSSSLRAHYESMDIVQSAFRAALPNLTGFHPQSAGALLNWLSKLAVNRIRDAHDYEHAQKRDRNREEPFDESAAPEPCSDSNPERETMLNELRATLDDKVANLPEDERETVLSKDYYGEDWSAIADSLGRSVGAVKMLHQRAWIRLRRELRPALEGRSPGSAST